MDKCETTGRSSIEGCMNIDLMRSLVKQYSELGQWTSALFWADAAAAAAGGGVDAASGDDVWLLASAMLARGELHRAAHAVTSRGLHRRHLLCLGVAMRAYLAAREPAMALNLMDECDPMLLEPRTTDQTHNRALAGVLVWQARALTSLERREAAAEALSNALRADCAQCLVACLYLYDIIIFVTELELIESLPISTQLSAAEGALLRAAYRERLNRYSPAPHTQPAADSDCPITAEAEAVGSRMMEAAQSRARRLAAACRWQDALRALDTVDPWCCVDVRAACLVELKKSTELFAFAHSLVDAYPNVWSSWYAVGCYYYLIGKSELARRYLSKAKSLEPSAGCVWLAYGHSFAADSEHDQAMAAYFKIECVDFPERAKWHRVVTLARDPHVAHEAGAAAFADGDYRSAHALWLAALDAATPPGREEVPARWAGTLDALGHACRALGRPGEALQWHGRALALRPARPSSLTASGLCLALLGRERAAADVLHAALARDPDDVVALALLDAIVDRLDAALTEEEIPQFPFPTVNISVPAIAPDTPTADNTNTSDMSMSFD
ncbi:hypothetical protein B5X24_HaOG208425 [Helicoverpa armigera]|uniref:Uncharacterized protein n=1 Tax=Helicoverpa armigera TaxID=29058 RepID=A0A2W1BMF6_HELAM|nr:hypothetical protein B5X24_HaOG208425 [Helicoverpa armigera]